MESAIRYYEMKYANDTSQAFIHLIREIGQIAFGMETNNKPVLEAKVVEATALLRFLAHKCEIDLDSKIEVTYAKKIIQFEKRKP